MLTKRQNLIETIRGGNPDRYVNQYEFMELVRGNPYGAKYPRPAKGEPPVKNGWGVLYAFPEGVPGPFPVHTPEHIVCKDITKWRDYVKAPSVICTPEEWEPYVKQAEAIDRNEVYAAAFVAPGLFEQCHYLLEIQNCLVQMAVEPDYMHELIEYITDWEIELAGEIIKYLKPDALFHHDDWGSSINSFMSPEMFEEYFVPAYKRLYGFYKANGVEIIVHHSDSYAANLVPHMIDIGIDIWQGATSSNNIPEVLAKHGGPITIMGGIDNGIIDRADWTQEHIDSVVEDVCRQNGTKFFIPCNVMGGPEAIYPGVYEASTAAIKKANDKLFNK